MTDTQAETLSVVVERDLSHPAEKIWRALTQPHLLEAWLMKTDFEPALNRAELLFQSIALFAQFLESRHRLPLNLIRVEPWKV